MVVHLPGGTLCELPVDSGKTSKATGFNENILCVEAHVAQGIARLRAMMARKTLRAELSL